MRRLPTRSCVIANFFNATPKYELDMIYKHIPKGSCGDTKSIESEAALAKASANEGGISGVVL